MADDPYKYFRIEARELLDGLGQGVLLLEKGTAGKDVVARLLRFAHTLKGAARVVRLVAIAEDAHALEDVLARYKEPTGPVRVADAEALFAGLDKITAQVNAIDGAAGAGRGAGADEGDGSQGTHSPHARAPASSSGSPAAATSDAPVAATAAFSAGRASADEPFETVRIEVREMDGLLEGLAEVRTKVHALDAALEALNGAEEAATLVEAELVSRSPEASGRAGAGTAATWARARTAASGLRERVAGARRDLSSGLGNVESELARARDAAHRLRLLPASAAFPALERAARDAAHSQGKTIAFTASGGEHRLDAHVLAGLREALLHVVRNAVAHGIETPDDRALTGKSPTGNITLEVERRGGRIAFVCKDDGRGVNVEALRRAAMRHGLGHDEVRAMAPSALFELMLQGGLTTTRTVTELSGRGVGLDVVRETAARLKGDLRVESEPGRGTTLEICVPLSLSSLEALAVDGGGISASIPLDAIFRTMRVEESQIARGVERDTILVDDRPIPFLSLANALGGAPSISTRASSVPFGRTTPASAAVIVASGKLLAAIGVERIVGIVHVVVRPLPPDTGADAMVLGAWLDADGTPELVLDARALVATAHAARGASAASRAKSSARAAQKARPPVLVIDDSLTTRMLEQSILESAGYEVEVATSAEEGLDKATLRRYGLFLVDVEMPGMNGYDFVTKTRADPILRETPAILVTSRGSVDDRRRGEEAGAFAYIVKSEFDQGRLLETIRGLIG